MDWIVFGDDWGAHPSTTQHLVKNLPRTDRVIWVNSLGGRAPRVNRRDVARLWKKLRSVFRPDRKPSTTLKDHRGAGPSEWSPHRQISPAVLPWHRVRSVRSVNRKILGRQIRSAVDDLGFESPNVLMSFPVAIWYMGFPFDSLAYLRLDDYGRLPGVDAALVRDSEHQLYGTCEVVFVTAEQLEPADPRVRSTYLPQGVDTDHFGSVPSNPPGTKTLGFFGLLAEWVDFDLIVSVASQLTDWTLEFVGPTRFVPESIRDAPNIRLMPPVPYSQLPGRLLAWDAAWIPFNVDELTIGVNPLKLREYLAAGLPTLCTALPEARKMGEHVRIVRGAGEVIDYLVREVPLDTEEKREARKRSVQNDSWAHRSRQLRDAVLAG